MKKVTLLTSILLLLPLVASAQTFQNFLVNLVTFINNAVIPFLIGIAFLFFVYNAIRFFVLGGANEDDQDKAKALAIYGVAAFVFLIIFWGIVGMLSSSIGLDNCSAPLVDYYMQKTGTAQTLCP